MAKDSFFSLVRFYHQSDDAGSELQTAQKTDDFSVIRGKTDTSKPVLQARVERPNANHSSAFPVSAKNFTASPKLTPSSQMKNPISNRIPKSDEPPLSVDAKVHKANRIITKVAFSLTAKVTSSQDNVSDSKRRSKTSSASALVQLGHNGGMPFQKNIGAPVTSEENADAAAGSFQSNKEDKKLQAFERAGLFTKLKNSLVKTRQNLGSRLIRLFCGKKIDDDLFEKLEEQLLMADVGVKTTRKIIDSLIDHADLRHFQDAEALYNQLRKEMATILINVERQIKMTGEAPFVILMVGVNGVGKTTTIGKLAHRYQIEGKSVMLAAGDTFRVAAVEQLQVWGERNHISVIAQQTGADSASVIFDAIQAAKARGIDVLIADTAGRLQNKAHLIDELKKIVKVIKKLDVDAPHETMLTLDASTGQNAVNQVNLFNDAIGLTGITLTKLDGTAKGGVIFPIANHFGIPIRFIGVGETIEDLQPFKADDFIKALFA
ncbi:signal recognition particle-docking protein FtsY [Candidatus Doolittlea endobia]|uniref:Signal recognition particle receptor FtsY n=1 Tax=Candidatus Doolittlea endobia TaxID=1778262 RepID=A0A143WV36_9ENTR|nr:signal recognition particle-docking protein FtsY [Candidatus Doolittlea endobia]CUX96759.1 Signal recognition particle receptor FtsY [Candidatus Doolittlea endobia]